MAGYNDDQLGAGEEEGEGEGEGGVSEGACPDPRQTEYDQVLLQTAMEDFEKNFRDNVEV